MRLPPRWLRRCVAPIVLAALLVVAVAVLLVAIVPLAVLSVIWPTARRALRAVVFAPVALAVEAAALVAAFWLWITRGDEAAHYRVLGHSLRALVRSASALFALELDDEIRDWPAERLARSDHPLLVLCRHAGPGDSLVVLDALITHFGLRPALVMKERVRLDPVIDVYFDRLPAAFIDPRTDGGRRGGDAIGPLARRLGSGDALVMFPEGGNYTPRRRRRAIRHLVKRGHYANARRARRLRHVMPPRPGGVLAILEEATVDVLVIGHTGFGDIHSAGDAWRSLGRPKPLALKAWFTPAHDVPVERDQRIAWLFEAWSAVDKWVASEVGRPGAPAAR